MVKCQCRDSKVSGRRERRLKSVAETSRKFLRNGLCFACAEVFPYLLSVPIVLKNRKGLKSVVKLKPVSWLELVRNLRIPGFEGSYRGGKHSFMVQGNLVLTIPNPHRKDIGVDLPARILKQAGISKEEWPKVT
jgi:predicted RNA binding protein YcfA (HicA-like mRNA interferase family)